jgi:uncharacterized protein (DUF934 family)
MANIIKDKAVQADASHYLNELETINVNELPQGVVAVRKSVFDAELATLLSRGDIAVIINGDDDLESLAAHLSKLAFVAIEFPAFADGRGYSLARLLREKHDYKGDIRAIGDVLPDQLSYMLRSGFSSFKLRDSQFETYALGRLEDFKQPYQSDASHAEPLFKRQSL